MKLKDNIFYNHISYERIDMIDKLAFVYWYEHMSKKGYKLTQKDTEEYEQVKHEILDYGYAYIEGKNK